MYSSRPGLITAFHGCDESLVHKVVSGQTELRSSNNKYDWIGHGIYFWDSSPSRAFEFARFLNQNPGRRRKVISRPAIVGAVINLGLCLDLLDYHNLRLLKIAYGVLRDSCSAVGKKMPINKPASGNQDLLLRELDCAVIEMVHHFQQQKNIRPFDSVRGVFWEGEELYPNAGFREKNHIQICIRNPNCIKGFFHPRQKIQWP
ncbi:hypothetical protein HHL17_30330 [Chitinophaga sp. G-6-1-13]|uniref:DUF3990 domain-containing protein n=1 Tax=Chitinophaga fulva TaxID=2728842 RepID=A0A848GXR0_9BACT|nr:hypothetical protein [Chitinophaga fulva]NML41520.1 hypothetical protein [Chitinophaga fulva]